MPHTRFFGSAGLWRVKEMILSRRYNRDAWLETARGIDFINEDDI